MDHKNADIINYQRAVYEERKLLKVAKKKWLSQPVNWVQKMIESKTNIDLMAQIEALLIKILLKYLKNFVMLKAKEKMIDEVNELMGDRDTNEVVSVLKKDHQLRASLKGFFSGVGGLIVSMVELTFMIQQIIHMVEKLAIIYEIYPFDYFEKIYIMKLIELSVASSPNKKEQIHAELKVLESEIRDPEIRLVEQEQRYQAEKVVLGVAKELAVELVTHMVYQSLPFVGAGVGAVVSYNFIDQIYLVSEKTYKRRYLEKKWVYSE